MKKITKDTYLSWYEDMLFWRKFEDKLAAVYIQQKVRGFLHLYNGQEAVHEGNLQEQPPDHYKGVKILELSAVYKLQLVYPQTFSKITYPHTKINMCP